MTSLVHRLDSECYRWKGARLGNRNKMYDKKVIDGRTKKKKTHHCKDVRKYVNKLQRSTMRNILSAIKLYLQWALLIDCLVSSLVTRSHKFLMGITFYVSFNVQTEHLNFYITLSTYVWTSVRYTHY